MTFAELVTEVEARGFDDLGDATGEARIKRWLNQAYREITDSHPWPFLEANKEGTAPMTFTDLAHVLSVIDKTNDERLRPMDRRSLLRWDPDLSETGSALYWYMEGDQVMKVYPGDTASTFIARYLTRPAELAKDEDTPLVPTPYQGLIVDGAVVRALKNRNNYEAAQFVREEWQRGLNQMAHALMRKNYDQPFVIQRTGYFEDYI